MPRPLQVCALRVTKTTFVCAPTLSGRTAGETGAMNGCPEGREEGASQRLCPGGRRELLRRSGISNPSRRDEVLPG